MALLPLITAAFAAKPSTCHVVSAFVPAVSIRQHVEAGNQVIVESGDNKYRVTEGDDASSVQPKASVFNGVGISLTPNWLCWGLDGGQIQAGMFFAADTFALTGDNAEFHLPAGATLATYVGDTKNVMLGVGVGMDLYGYTPNELPQSTADNFRIVGFFPNLIDKHPDRFAESWVIYVQTGVGFGTTGGSGTPPTSPPTTPTPTAPAETPAAATTSP